MRLSAADPRLSNRIDGRRLARSALPFACFAVLIAWLKVRERPSARTGTSHLERSDAATGKVDGTRIATG
jgi:hypothetical protein